MFCLFWRLKFQKITVNPHIKLSKQKTKILSNSRMPKLNLNSMRKFPDGDEFLPYLMAKF
jgi:hypothetical protein